MMSTSECEQLSLPHQRVQTVEWKETVSVSSHSPLTDILATKELGMASRHQEQTGIPH